MAAVMQAILECFWPRQGHDLSVSGAFLQLSDGSTLHVWMRLGIVIADEAALHFAYACKGAAGFRPCLLCANIHNRLTARPIGPHDLPHTTTEWHAVQLHTPGSLAEISRQLAQAARDRPAALADLETQLGWTYVADSILFSTRWFSKANCTSSVCFDWMHIFLVGGVFNVHVGVMMHALKPLHITAEMLHTYLQLFSWPSAVPSGGIDVFDKKGGRVPGKTGLSKAPLPKV